MVGWRRMSAMAAVAGILAAASLALSPTALAQTCSWGGTSTGTLPPVTALRAYPGPLHAPARLAVDREGRLYVTDPRAGRIVVRDRYGRLVAVVERFAAPLAIAADAAGRIYIGDQATGSVAVLDARWTPLHKLGHRDGEFLLPNDIAVDVGTGRLYVADSEAHAIKVYDADGTFLSSFGSRGPLPGQLDFPAGVYVSAAGEVFVADQNNDRVQVFDRTGAFLRCFGRRGSYPTMTRRFGRIQGVTGDAEGVIYVADAFQGEVAAFDPLGRPLGTVGRFGEAPGELRTPLGLALDADNRLFVASANNARVEVFGLDGYRDPRVVPASVEVKPDRLERSSRRRFITALIELRGYPLDDVVPGSITANGVPAAAWADERDADEPEADEADEDEIPRLTVKFDARAVLATLPDGKTVVVVAGELRDGTAFEGTGTVRVTSREVKR